MTTITRCLPILLSLLASEPAMAQGRPADNLAAAVPAEVIEVQSGGTWQDGATSGMFRVVTTVSGLDKDYGARVFIQWLAVGTADGQMRIHKSTPVKEFNDLKMPHVVVAFDSDVPGEASIVLVSQDAERRRDVLVSVRTGKPGTYSVTEKPNG
jgi:hypothetical protein